MRPFVWLGLFGASLFLLGALGAVYCLFRPSHLASSAEGEHFTIHPNWSGHRVAEALHESGYITSESTFRRLFWGYRLVSRLKGKGEPLIQSGTYALHAKEDYYTLFDKITQGKVLVFQATLIEGQTTTQYLEALAADTSLVRPLSVSALPPVLYEPFPSPEGAFLAESYHYTSDTPVETLLARAHKALQNHLTTIWAARAPNLPYKSPYEALIMASIIEKETGVPDERPLIASVFVNRLRLGMPLQTDPTVIYGMGTNYKGNIRKKDLQTDTPYNTYTRRGLPPTPIANVGLDSIKAALQPATSDYLYFVAKGDGTHYFSKNLHDHQAAVVRYQLRH